MSLPIPIGIDDFRKLRERGMAYVDKTALIRGILDKGAEVILLPRPRRFGKTLNMTMLRCFLEKRPEDFSPLFSDLSIWSAGETYRTHFQRYPVLAMTFKDVKAASWDQAWPELRRTIAELFVENQWLLTSGRLTEREARDFRAVLEDTAEPVLFHSALLDLSRILHRISGEPVVILIDEYDSPFHAGDSNGCAKEVLDFFRAFMSAGLKGNPHLFKAVITGILRIAKETIFSGLNNPAVYSLLRSDFASSFGFSEPEVIALLEQAGRRDRLSAVKAWYNGYDFGGTVIYNPWSILNYIDSPDPEPQPFWVNTSSNDLVREALIRHAPNVRKELETLLEGGGVDRYLDDNVVLSDLDSRTDTLFSLLVFTGYLRAERRAPDPDNEAYYHLSIPNREVRRVYTSTFRDWMTARLGGESNVERLKRALFEGDAETVEEELGGFTGRVLSYHDTALRPEQVYHAFVIGLLATLEPAFEVRSNRESGMGRPDVTIRPRKQGQPGVILELKVAKPGRKTPEQALAEGVEQIQSRGYKGELLAAGASPVQAFAVAFDGKAVRVVTV